MKRILRILLILMLALAVLCACPAGPAQAKDKTLGQLNKEIKQKQAQLDKGQKKEAELMKSLVDLEGEIDQLQGKITEGEADLEQLKKDLEKTKKEVKQQNEALGLRLRNMYKNGSVGFVDVLLRSGSFSEFLTNLDMVQMIFQSDEEVLESLKSSYERIEKKKARVEQLQSDLEAARGTVESEWNEVLKQKKAVASANAKTSQQIDDLEDQMAAVQAELARKAKEGKISSSKTSKYEGGAFKWPTPGNEVISSEYGWRECPFHGREFHAALDIAAPMGAKVIAAASGKVIEAGWGDGFGNTVIIDHGGGLTSQYNHLSAIDVTTGQKVDAGEKIAEVGSTGFSTGPHLDFRVYENGEVVNPRTHF